MNSKLSANMKRLTAILEPPKKPKEGKGDWSKVEKTLKLELPDDYKAFISTYGSGRICGFFTIFNPFAKNRHTNLLKSGLSLTQWYAEMNDSEYPTPFPAYPEADGLLVFSMTDNGDHLHWHTEGKANDWYVGIFKKPNFNIYKSLGFVEFLIKLLKNEIKPDPFPAMRGEPVAFTQSSP